MVPTVWLSGFLLSSGPWSSIGTSCTGNKIYLDPQREVKYLIESLQQASKKEWKGKKKKKAIEFRKKLREKMCAGFNTACPLPPQPWAGPVKMETALLELEILLFHFSL